VLVAKNLQRLGQLDALIVRQHGEQGRAIRTLGSLQHRTMHTQRFDRPRIHLAQPIIVFQRAHDPAGARSRTVRLDAVVAARGASGARQEWVGIVIDRRDIKRSEVS